MLQNLEEHVETLRASVQPAVELAEVADTQAAELAKEIYAVTQTQAAEQSKEIYANLQTGCEPLFQLFRKVSSDESNPGDLMDRKFQKVETELSRLAQKMATEQRSESGGGGGGTELSPSPLRSSAFWLSGMSGDNHVNTISPSRGSEPGSGSGGQEMSLESEGRFHSIEPDASQVGQARWKTLQVACGSEVLAGYLQSSERFAHLLHGRSLFDGSENQAPARRCGARCGFRKQTSEE